MLTLQVGSVRPKIYRQGCADGRGDRWNVKVADTSANQMHKAIALADGSIR
jgi:hypothetical protein